MVFELVLSEAEVWDLGLIVLFALLDAEIVDLYVVAVT